MAITVDVTPNNTTVSPQESVTTTLDITTSIPTISAFRPLINAANASGDGSLAYDSNTGVFTYTGPSASEVRAHLSAGTGVTYSSGEFSIGQDVATTATPTFAAMTIDSISINGTTIGHTSDTNLLTLASGQVTVAGTLSATSITSGVSINTGAVNATGLISGSALDVNSASIAGAVTDVTTLTASGEIEGGSLDINGAASIAGAVTDVTTLTASGEIEGGSLDINGNADISGNLTGVDTLTATTFSGSGASLTNLPAAQLSGAIANGVTATTQSASDNSTKVATTAYTDTAIANLVNSAPSTLDTLGEIATSLNNNASLESSLTSSIATKLPLAGGQMIGNITFSGTQTVDGRDLSEDGAKLDNIEPSATADQTAAEIRALVESASDSNVFTDDDHSKLNAIEASADVTDATNVTAAGALMDSEVTNLAQVKAFDASDYVAASAVSTFGGTLIDDADAAAARTTLGLGTVATTASGDYVAATAVSTFGGTLIDDADAAAARTTLGLGTVATTASTAYAPAAGSSSIVTTGALNSGSITSGFTSIDVGSGAISTTGTISAGDVTASGTVSADAYTGSQTAEIDTVNKTMSSFKGQKVIHTGSGAATYTFPDVVAGDKGTTWTVVNASTAAITISRGSSTTLNFSKLIGSADPSSLTTITIAKGGVAEFVVTAANTITAFGSGF